jgi:hypothetical protein
LNRFFLEQTSLAARFDVINVFDQSYLLHEAGIVFTVDQYDECRGFFGGISYYFLSLSLDRSARTGEHAGHLARAVAGGYIDSMWMIDSTAGGGIALHLVQFIRRQLKTEFSGLACSVAGWRANEDCDFQRCA